jgi:hypothetical protein
MTDKQWNNLQSFGVSDPDDYLVDGPQIMLTGGPLRAVATGAILFFNGQQPIKRLVPLKPETVPEHLEQLEEWWGIQSGNDARQVLSDLHHTGHRARFQPQLARNPGYWREQFDRHEFLRSRPVESVTAWDFCRIVNVAYWTRAAGLLDDATAFSYFDIGTKLALERFRSWEDMAVSFLAGRVMWNADDEGHEHMGNIVEYLLEDEENVWGECAWADYPQWWPLAQ